MALNKLDNSFFCWVKLKLPKEISKQVIFNFPGSQKMALPDFEPYPKNKANYSDPQKSILRPMVSKETTH